MRWISMFLVLVLIADFLAHRPVDEVSFLQVGQGDATLISIDGTNIMVDSGPRNLGFDSGQRFVWPELRKRGIRHLDAVVLTHFDQDHYGGLRAVMERVRVDRVVIVSRSGISNENLAVLQEAGVRSNQVVLIDSIQKLTIGELSLDIVPGFEGDTVDDNEKSPFIGVNFGNDRVILTGDAPTDSELYWISLGVSGGRIVKAGHHGSSRSTSSEWIESMEPDYIVFSCGRNNPWGHPSPVALDRVASYGAKNLRTDTLGTIRFRPDSQGKLRLVAGEYGSPLLELFKR